VNPKPTKSTGDAMTGVSDGTPVPDPAMDAEPRPAADPAADPAQRPAADLAERAAGNAVQRTSATSGHPFAHAMGRVLTEREPRKMRLPGVTAAAVLVALFEADGEVRVWLLRRPAALRTHAGQVALPGGKKDAGDPTIVQTALREADEEIGLHPSSVKVLGLGDEYITVTRYAVTPVVAWVTGPFEPKPNPAEASRVFSAPFSLFRDRGLVRAIPLESVRRLMRTYEVDGEIVWGATAAILCNLARLVRIR
jgi:8-oxo-dGTP pyrophosphatase MutT (NUDIX family)